MDNGGSVVLGGGAPAPLIEIRRDGKRMATVHPDGRVEYHGEYAPDEAARAFWEALSTFCPVRQYAEALVALSAEKEKRQAAQGGVTEAMVDDKAREMYEAYRTANPNARMYPWNEQHFQPTRDHWKYKARASLEAALSAQQGQGEAAARVQRGTDGQLYAMLLPQSKAKEGQTLYTAPPAQPAERVPELANTLVNTIDSECELVMSSKVWEAKEALQQALTASPAPSEGGKGVEG